MNQANLILRFLLEITVLVITGMWGWRQAEGIVAWLFALGLPLLFAAAWGTFAIPNDPSRSGKAPVPTTGWIRLGLELAFFAASVLALVDMAMQVRALIMAGLVLFHYSFSYRRIQWMLLQKK